MLAPAPPATQAGADVRHGGDTTVPRLLPRLRPPEGGGVLSPSPGTWAPRGLWSSSLVQEVPLEVVLERTAYCSRAMQRNKKSVRSRQSLEDLTAQLVLGVPERQEEDGDVVIEEDEEEDEVVVVDSVLDQLFGQCFLQGGTQEFQVLEEELVGEGEVVAYRHSVTGVTALMVAASRGRREVVELALQQGADTRVRAANGWTALDFARKTGQQECVRLVVFVLGGFADWPPQGCWRRVEPPRAGLRLQSSLPRQPWGRSRGTTWSSTSPPWTRTGSTLSW